MRVAGAAIRATIGRSMVTALSEDTSVLSADLESTTPHKKFLVL